MDGDRFDNLTRALANGQQRTTSRRKLLSGLAGGALAAAFGRRASDTAAACPPGAVTASGGRCLCKTTGRAPVNGTCTGAGSPGGSCGAGQTLCNGACIDASSDPNHCGACNRPCPGGANATAALCRAGLCTVVSCAPGYSDCNATGFDGCETPLGTNANCGRCGDACPSGQSCQSGTCVCPPGTCGPGCTLVICPDNSCKQGATGACANDTDCCSGVCVGGICQGGCIADGGICDSATDCCAATCVTSGGGGPNRCCASGKACGSTCCANAAQVCDLNGACCTINTCQPGQCGTHPNGCGGNMDCGGCAEPGDTCGGGGTPGVCGCTDNGAACAGRVCGTAVNNCGDTVSCGPACPSGQACSAAGQCVCVPADPETVCAGKCGLQPDGCRNSIDCTARCSGCCTIGLICVADGTQNTACGTDGGLCHNCLLPDTCGGGGTPHVCGCTSSAPAVTCSGKCGTVIDNCGREVNCSGCGSGLTCCEGTCVDLLSDNDYCGRCDRACQSSPADCVSSICQFGNCISTALLNCCQSDDECFDASPCTVSTCDPHTLTCRHDPDPSANNTPCGTGKVCCAGACIVVTDDPANCGACGNICAENEPCGPCPPGQTCLDRGPGCCESGTCSAGRCTSKALPLCGSCATPLCDPDLGSICASHCPPPPDVCFGGPGVCQFNGTCTYPPKCGICETCDPSTGACSPKTCGPCEQCDATTGQCVYTCKTCEKCDANGTTCRRLEFAEALAVHDCGFCGFCDPSSSVCLNKNSGTPCGCGRCDGAGTCLPSPDDDGSSCGVCKVCRDGFCGFADSGASCGVGNCHHCDGVGSCVPKANGTPCADGKVCDGSGSCVCALICGGNCCPAGSAMCCGDRCCPSGTVECCATLGNSTCCAVHCEALPTGGVICPV